MKPICLVAVALLSMVAEVRGDEPKAYRPVAAALIDDSHIVVANRDRGSVSVVDVRAGKVAGELPLGKQIVDVEQTGDGRFLALDHRNHQVILSRFRDETLEVQRRISVKPFPIAAAVSGSGQWCAVTSLWSRQLSICRLSDEGLTAGDASETRELSIRLPVAPRCVMLLEDLNRIVVADAFGGTVIVVSYDFDDTTRAPSSLKIDSVRTVPGHNISHLAVDGEGPERRLYMTQMVLNGLAEPQQDEIHWGSYIASSLRSIALKSLLDPKARLLDGGKLSTLGDVAHGAADPSGFVIDAHDRRIVAMAGTDEVTLFDAFGSALHRIAVGAGPCCLLSIGGTEYVTVNTFDDSVSVIDIPFDDAERAPRVIRTVALSGSQAHASVVSKQSETLRGERLFHSAGLSHDGWLSCHSCHTGGHTCGLNADTLGDGNLGAAKRVLSLHGIKDTLPLAWNGTMTFESQVRKSVTDTMHGPAPSEADVNAIVRYMKSLPPLPRNSSWEDHSRIDRESVARGKRVFKREGCAKCHAGKARTSEATYDVGLTDSMGEKKFNPPSLRGIIHRQRFFHDSRAKSLTEVFTKYHHPDGRSLDEPDLADLIRYLESL